MGAGITCQRGNCTDAIEDCANEQYVLSRKTQCIFGECTAHHASSAFSGSSGSRRTNVASEPSLSQKFKVRLNLNSLAVAHSGNKVDWRRRYVLGPELGAGQTATVFEAHSTGSSQEDSVASFLGTRCAGPSSCTSAFGQDAPSEKKTPSHMQSRASASARKVALKRFHTSGTSMFQAELQAFLRVGIHPHILRLLDAFHGSADMDDVLVLERCDGGDVYELYARNDGCCMLEAFVIQIISQLLSALQHLATKGIEHRDVKPENLLLFSSQTLERQTVPQLKLGDFGWAAFVDRGANAPPVPPDGVGSLWYAPPELNPPGRGAAPQKNDGGSRHWFGRSDMWSVGVITYLLLIGHSPFNVALRIADPAQREAEVLTLAEAGRINMLTRPWTRLSVSAKSFITALVQPEPCERLSVDQATQHPWIRKWLEGVPDTMSMTPESMPRGCTESDRNARWQSLDLFQRLSWLAVARAVTEPELAEVPYLQAFILDERGGKAPGYFENLAKELATLTRPHWLSPTSSWGDIYRLAFNYLDHDHDFLLNHSDLSRHLEGEDSYEVVDVWLARWRTTQEVTLPFVSVIGLSFADFLAALAHKEEAIALPIETIDVANDSRGCNKPASKCGIDAVLETRFHAIDENCQRFLDEEFDDFGFGL